MTYKDLLTVAMGVLANDKRTLFIGQSVKYGGQAMFPTFEKVSYDKRIEFPVCEDMQLGFCTGLSFEGYVPVSIFPRFDFLILAINQLVNHLDKIPLMSEFKPKVIIRTAVGSNYPLNPGHQHVGDYTEAIKRMVKTIDIVELHFNEDIVPSYKAALDSDRSTLLVEYAGLYGQK